MRRHSGTTGVMCLDGLKSGNIGRSNEKGSTLHCGSWQWMVTKSPGLPSVKTKGYRLVGSTSWVCVVPGDARVLALLSCIPHLGNSTVAVYTRSTSVLTLKTLLGQPACISVQACTLFERARTMRRSCGQEKR